jgi:glycosyltransferase involved in cell wall biosynthesis
MEEPNEAGGIRVLVVSAQFLPVMGGIETHINETVSRICSSEDIDISVLSTDRSGRLPSKEQFPGFTVERCRSYPRKRDYYIAPDIYRRVRTADVDILHCQGIHTAVPILAMLAAKRRGLPFMVTLHTGGHSSSVRNRLRRIQWRLLAPLLRGAESIVSVGRYEQQLFQEVCRLDGSRFTIIRNGGDLGMERAAEIRIPGRIISSGRLERYKGHHRVIQALPMVRQTIPNATVKILGSGPYADHLHTLVRDLHMEDFVSIESIPPSDRKQMMQSLSEAAVFAAMSEYEAHPIAVMEALALGVPVVGCDVAGVGDLVEDGLVTGVPKDAKPDAVAQALIAALSSPKAAEGPPLRTWDTTAGELADVYRCVSRSARGVQRVASASPKAG